MSEAQYTVFSADGFQDNGGDQGEFAGVPLQCLIDRFMDRWPNSILISWASNLDVYERGMHLIRDESQDAGRTIEYDLATDSYVARGMTPTLDKLEAEKGDYPMQWDVIAPVPKTTCKRVARKPADPNAAMIARDGPAKTTPRHLVKAILEDLATPLSTAHKAIPGLTRMSAQDHRLGLGRSFG